MFSKVLAASALVAMVAAQNPYQVVTNLTPQTIVFAYTGVSDSLVMSGTIPPNSSTQFDLGDSRNVKMCYTCSPYGATSGILQFESDLGNSGVNYDWSLINGPNPFSGYEYTITPWSGNCPTWDCAAGDTSNDCQYTTSGDFNPVTCPVGPVSGAQLTAVIG